MHQLRLAGVQVLHGLEDLPRQVAQAFGARPLLQVDLRKVAVGSIHHDGVGVLLDTRLFHVLLRQLLQEQAVAHGSGHLCLRWRIKRLHHVLRVQRRFVLRQYVLLGDRVPRPAARLHLALPLHLVLHQLNHHLPRPIAEQPLARAHERVLAQLGASCAIFGGSRAMFVGFAHDQILAQTQLLCHHIELRSLQRVTIVSVRVGKDLSVIGLVFVVVRANHDAGGGLVLGRAGLQLVPLAEPRALQHPPPASRVGDVDGAAAVCGVGEPGELGAGVGSLAQPVGVGVVGEDGIEEGGHRQRVREQEGVQLVWGVLARLDDEEGCVSRDDGWRRLIPAPGACSQPLRRQLLQQAVHEVEPGEGLQLPDLGRQRLQLLAEVEDERGEGPQLADLRRQRHQWAASEVEVGEGPQLCPIWGGSSFSGQLWSLSLVRACSCPI
eukprot:scaffold36690_cov60-Phaeocystis_antarctica.AAC.1